METDLERKKFELNISEILETQKTYYRKRASEYDEWFYRMGRYDRGFQNNADWFSDIEDIKHALVSEKKKAPGSTLEIAAGTGIWTQLLKDHSTHVHAMDFSPEVLEIKIGRASCRERVYVLV